MKIRKIKLTARIALSMGFIIAIIIGFIIAIIGVRLNRDITVLLNEENIQITNARAAELGKLLDTYYWLLRSISTQEFLVSGDKLLAEDRMLNTIIKDVPSDVGTSLVAWEDGSAKTPAGTYVSVKDRGYFQAIMLEKKDYAIGDVDISKSSNVPAVLLAKAIKTGDGAMRGLVAFEIKMDTLSSIAASVKLGKTGYGWIVDQRGLVIAHPSEEAILTLDTLNSDKDGYKGLDAFGRLMQSTESGVSEYIERDGTKMVTYYARVPNSPGWTLGISISEAELTSSVTSLIYLLILILFLGIAASLTFSILFARSIVKPIRLIVQELGLLANGDLALAGFDISASRKLVSRGDELGDAGQSMETMLQALKKVVKEIMLSSQNVSSGSTQLSDTAQGLSQGANEQAASIEELSASLEELASTIHQNADNTKQADSLSRRVVDNAEGSGKAVEETVASMKEIASKIGIIEEIARQTNLLALNAAIEAARAGEAGKGFAVVASEVRKLAERSAVAAGEINELSKRSVSVAGDAGARLEQLVPDIKKTAELIQEIASASNEQSSGAEQIAKGVSQIDTVVQQNAASSEELAAMVEELSGQAKKLHDTIEFFKLAESTGREVIVKEGPKTEKLPAKKEHRRVLSIAAEGDTKDEDFEEF